MHLNLKAQRLSSMAPLRDFESDALRLLAFDGEEVPLARDAVLFRQGDAADCGYAVLSGIVALEREGPVPVPVRLMTAGSLIGVSALVAPTERPATATAREPSLVLRLPRHLMLRVLEAFPDSALALRRHIEDDLARQAASLARIAQALEGIEARYSSRARSTGT
jgi:CRP-like cAMP-binding protein